MGELDETLKVVKKAALKEELADLAKKLTRVGKELDSKEFEDLTPHGQALLRSQYHSMGAYYYALEARIDILP